jgi:hypothetical protein
VARLVARLAAALGERDELIAHVDEGEAPNAAAEFERTKDRLPEGERLLEVRDLQSDVIDSNQLWHCAGRLVRKTARRRLPYPGAITAPEEKELT